MSSFQRSGQLDRGCGCGIRLFGTELIAAKALAKRASLPGDNGRLRVAECPRRPGSWHLLEAREATGPDPETRRLVLRRDGYRCVCCGTSVRGRHYSLGHRLRASQGGLAVPSNLITLLGLGAEEHHGRIDLYRDPDDAAKGYRLDSSQDPLQVPVMLFSEHGSGVTAWLGDDGRYYFGGPQRAAA